MLEISWDAMKTRLISTSAYPSWTEDYNNYIIWSHLDYPVYTTIPKELPAGTAQLSFESIYKTEGAGVESNVVLSGLSTGLSTTAIIVTDVPTLIPATANVLLNRNGISVRNMTLEPIYLGSSAVNISSGYPKFQYEEFVADIRDSTAVYIYAICASGASSEVRIMQLA